MKNGLIIKAVELGQKLGYVFLTTAANNGVPHLTVATKIRMRSKTKLSVAGWFCPGTVANLENNPNLGVSVWEQKSDSGYQLLGKKEDLREIAILNGYAPHLEKKLHLPQVEREVMINVEKVLEFKRAAHSDSEL